MDSKLIASVYPYLEEYLNFHGYDTSRSFRCLDPFHEDRNPSCSIVPMNRSVAHCFSCGQNFNIFDAAHYLDNRPTSTDPRWKEHTLYFLADMFSVARGGEVTEREIEQFKFYDLYSVASNIIVKYPPTEYLNLRNWSLDQAKDLGIGSIPSFITFINSIKNRGFDQRLIDIAGLNDNMLKSPKACIFTIYDRWGRAVGFATRNTDPGVPKEQRYCNTKSLNPIYKKREILYGLHLAKGYNSLYIVEGYADWVTMYMNGIHNVVAVGSNALGTFHANILKECEVSEIILSLDNDDQGRKGIESVLNNDHFLDNFNIKIVEYPPGCTYKDPDEYIKFYGAERFKELELRNPFTWFISREGKPTYEFDENGKSFELAKTCIEKIYKSSESVLDRVMMVKDLAKFLEETSISEDLLMKELENIGRIKSEARFNRISEIGKDLSFSLKKCTPEDLANILEDHLERIRVINSNFERKVDFDEDIESEIGRLFEYCESEKKRGYMCGIPRLDNDGRGIPIEPWFTVVGAKPNTGKLAPLYSKILTKDGWKTMGDMKVGEQVFGECGKLHTVIGVYPQGVHDIYRITFKDNTYTDCGLEHLWRVWSRNDRCGNNGILAKKEGRVVDTKYMMSRITRNNGTRLNFAIKYTQPIQFTKKELPMHPYLLGLLLGDGGMSGLKSNISFSNIEKDLLTKLINILPYGDNLVSCSKGGSNGIKDYRINGGNTKKLLKGMGLLGKYSYTKFIPSDYLISDVEDRLSLLRGLLDTDGYVDTTNSTNIEYSTSSFDLMQGVRELVLSLGGMFTHIERMGKYRIGNKTKKTRISYRCYISFKNGIIPVSSKKHLSKYKMPKFNEFKYIKSIEKVGREEAQCIKVDNPSHLYITDDYIVTHNTGFLSQLCYKLVELNRNVLSLYISLDDPYNMFASRIISHICGVSSENILHADYLKVNDIEKYKKVLEGFEKYKEMSKSKLKIFDGIKGRSLDSIERKIRYYQDKYGPDSTFVYIDSFHNLDDVQMGKSGGDEGQRSAINNASTRVKNMCTDLKAHIFATVHLRKILPGVFPTKADIRESGKIEFDATAAWMCYSDIADLGHNAMKYWEDLEELTLNEEWVTGDNPDKKYIPIKKPIFEMVIAKDKRQVAKEVIYFKYDGSKNLYTQLNATEIKKYIKAPQMGQPNPHASPTFGSYTPRVDIGGGVAPF